MPKVKPLDPLHEPLSRSRACIARYKALRGISDEQLAKRFGVHLETIKRRNEHPESMNLKTLLELSRVLGCPISELCGGELPEERLESVLKLIGSSR